MKPGPVAPPSTPDSAHPAASILLPTFDRAQHLAACIASLACQQAAEAGFEVVVGFDGPQPEAEALAQAAWNSANPRNAELRFIRSPRAGYTIVREQLIAAARGRIMISLNDDVTAAPGFVEAHLAAHRERESSGAGPAIIVGDAPYALRQPDTLLDRMVRETGLVFFYDVMNTPEARAQRDRDWGFRHCFGLNFSAPLRCVREAGGVLARPHLYGYDDIELAYRISRRFSAPVLYRPEATVTHHHFYTAEGLLERERQLGASAWIFAAASPDFARACFGRDIRSREEIEYSRAFVERERSAAERLRESFITLANLPAACVEGPQAPVLIKALAQQHLLLKRWMWRRGLLDAAEREHADDHAPAATPAYAMA